MEERKAEHRFVVLGENGSYIVKDTRTRTFVSRNILTEETAEVIRRMFEEEYAENEAGR